MKQESLSEIIADQTRRALWEVHNVIRCVPDDCWEKAYCHMPLWKHIYHMLHSLDLWMINPRDPQFQDPPIHEEGLNNLDVVSTKQLDRSDIEAYFDQIQTKVMQYILSLREGELLRQPQGCEYTKFTLIMAQHRHLHTHMGMIMGFIVAETGRWPRVVGLEGKIPQDHEPRFF